MYDFLPVLIFRFFLRTYRPKPCGNNNKDEDNSPKTLNDKNQQASSQKFRQLISQKKPSILGNFHNDNS